MNNKGIRRRNKDNKNDVNPEAHEGKSCSEESLARYSMRSTLDRQHANPGATPLIENSTDGRIQPENPWLPFLQQASLGAGDGPSSEAPTRERLNTPHQPPPHRTSPSHSSKKDEAYARKRKNHRNLPEPSVSSRLPEELPPRSSLLRPREGMPGNDEGKEGAPRGFQIGNSPSPTRLSLYNRGGFVQNGNGNRPTPPATGSMATGLSVRKGARAGAHSSPSVNFHDQTQNDTRTEKVDKAEELMEVSAIPARPIERFFVQCQNQTTGGGGAQNPEVVNSGNLAELRDEDEMVLAQFAEFTDDDSFFSDCTSPPEDKPEAPIADTLWLESTKSAHETLRLHMRSNGRFSEEYAWERLINAPWLYQIHVNGSALLHSSFFIFPARWTPRVIVYNIMHHWMYEIILFFMILSYCIFQATWARYSAPEGKMTKPDYMLCADTLFTVLFGIELLFGLFAKGFLLHSRAFFRSPWGWLDTAVFIMLILECTNDQRLWNFTAWRLIRCIKCLVRVPILVHLKILAKSLLRSTNGLANISLLLWYFIFFFALLGLQLFSGALHSRCVSIITDRVTNQICSNVSTGKYWFYWGHHCDKGYACIQDVSSNPHYGFRSFDDIGHAMLSTFQIMTFQGWTGLLSETNDAVAVAAFLYYFFTILLCTWIVPSMFLGAFITKIEKISRLFALKQLNVFNNVLLEQRQRVCSAVRLSDYIKQDKSGGITRYLTYTSRHYDGGNDDGASKYRFLGAKARRRRSVQNTYWTDERRLQLQLSLSRHRAFAEDAEQMSAKLSRKKDFGDSVKPSSAKRSARRPDSRDEFPESNSIAIIGPDTGVSERVPQEPDSFALGGCVNTVQHHPQTYTVGASRMTEESFAARQNAKSKVLHFLDPYADRNDLDVLPENYHDHPEPPLENGARASNGILQASSTPSANVHVTREYVGVVPPRHSASEPNIVAHRGNQYSSQRVDASKMSLMEVAPPDYQSDLVLIQDPEGGEFSLTDTCWDKLNIVRNILHMFTEGYPRILTEYMWKHRVMQYWYSLLPLKFANMYEENAMKQLQLRNGSRHIKAQGGMRRYDMFHDLDEPKVHESARGGVNRCLKEKGGPARWSMPLTRMAENIKQNAPITYFNIFMYVLILLNAVFNACRYDTMPDNWEKGTFFADIIFSMFFFLEMLIRILALGPGPFFVDGFNFIEFTAVTLSLFQLGFSRVNTISLFNWIRFLKLFRVCSVRSTRRVFRVLIRAIPGIVYALIFFSLYAFMWVLLGMSFFGSRTNWIDTQNGDYHTRANFETFFDAVYAVSQTFSLNRDEWLYLSWNGMRVRGGYTILYFIAASLTVFIFRFFFIAIFLWAFQAQEEHGVFLGASIGEGDPNIPLHSRRNDWLLPWFDFTVWRSFKHIHGGFKRRDVAPDEVYYINEDMQRELQFAEGRENYLKTLNETGYTIDRTPLDEHALIPREASPQDEKPPSGSQYFSVGDRLYPWNVLYGAHQTYHRRTFYENKAQLRFARERLFVPAELHGDGPRTAPDGGAAPPSSPHPQPPRHLLLPGPRMRYQTLLQGGRRLFERCQDCNTHKAVGLRAAPGVAQRTPDDLHAEHCHVAAVRSARQLVLDAVLGYVRLQADRGVRPTRHMIEVVLGQAWGCGMLLSENIDNLASTDLPQAERSWDPLLRALEIQRWLLELHIGEEQVGRATLAYILAHQKRTEIATQDSEYRESSKDHSFVIFKPLNPIRRCVTSIVESVWFQTFIFVIIFVSSICLAVYTPGEYNRDMGGSYNSTKYKFLHVADDVFTLIFTAEMLLKWVSMGVVLPVGRAYFWHLWNIFDCFIVISSLVSWFSHGVFLRYLKVFRCFRIIGPLRFWSWNPSMIPIARALWDSIPTLANICLAMLMNYVVWAIIFSSMFMNKMNTCSNATINNRTECIDKGFKWNPPTRNFGNFFESLLTTFEISTGAEWLDVIYNAVDSWSTEFPPVANSHPWKGLVFVGYYYVSHFVLFTFFISAMIYCYFISKSTIEDKSFRHQLWSRMEEGVLRIQPRIRMIPSSGSASRFSDRIVRSRRFELLMSSILWCNMVTMALQWYQMTDTQKTTLSVFDLIFVVLFTIEVLLRLIAHGLRMFTRWAYCWDLLVVCLSYIQLVLNSSLIYTMPFDVNVLRLLRVARVLRLFNLVTFSGTHLMLLKEVLQASIPSLINVTLIYMLAVYVFAIAGLHFLGYIVPYGGYIDGRYNNFMTFVNSLIMVFRLSTLQDWATMLRGSLDRGNYCGKADHRCGPTNYAPVYYIAIVVLFFLMICSLYIAVIMDHYISSVQIHARARFNDLYYFCELWSRRDPNVKLTLPATQIPKILQELHLPLGINDLYNRAELLRWLREYDIPVQNGCVHYYAVLFPLASRAMAMSFPEDVGLGGGFEVPWRPPKQPMGATTPEFQYVGEDGAAPGRHTLAEWYAVSYIQAACRRNRAMRNYFIMKSQLWRDGRSECLRLGLPYAEYGFGAQSLDAPDPCEEGRRRGFNVAEDETAKGSPVFASTTDKRALRAELQRQGGGGTVSLPVVHHTAIRLEEERFGPNAPNAVRRHERRTEKLRRRREQEEMEERRHRAPHWAFGDGGIPQAGRVVNPFSPVGGGALPESLARSAHGDHPERPRSSNMSRIRVIAVSPPLDRNGSSRRISDPRSPSYQPPLGTDPEVFQNEEISRRSQLRSNDEFPTRKT